MDISSTIKAVMSETGFSMQRVANIIGASQQSVSGYVNRSRNMRVDSAVRMLNAMGYDLVAVPRGMKVPSGSIVIDVCEEQK